MQQGIFVRELLDRVARDLPEELGAFHVEARASIGKLWSGNRWLHYECGGRLRQGTVELGLHFEADPLTNARLLGGFRAHERGIRHRLGSAVRLEGWDRGWARLWESHEVPALDEKRCAELAARLTRYVLVLEPILRRELPVEVSWRPV